MSKPTTLPDHERRIENELLDIYAHRGPLIGVTVVLSALIIEVLAWDAAPRWPTVGGACAAAAALLIRGLVGRWLPLPSNPLSLPTRLRLATALSGMSGIVYGSSVAFWPYLGSTGQLVQSMFVIGMCAGATHMCYLPVSVAYLLPMLASLGFTWAQAASSPSAPSYGSAFGMMLLFFICYGGLLLMLTRATCRLHSESFDNRKRLSLALARAEAANRSKTRFLASASHDLRQPLHALALFGVALTMRPLDDRARDIAQQMNVALQALNSELDALLDISKLDAGVVSVTPSNFALTHFLRRIADELRPLAEQRGIALVVESEPPVGCHTDPVLIERVVRNLVDNAIKYTTHGSVTLAAAYVGSGCEVRIRDTGPGIPESEQERVFEEFYQLDNPARTRTLGLGLGLSIVRRLAELLQLDMSMNSAPGRGTEFVLHLRAATTAPPSSGHGPAPVPITGLHVLVVDDEESVRNGMGTLLEGLGCRASVATGTESALRLVTNDRPDIVLADFRLRDGDNGIETVRRLRAVHPGLAALLVSGDIAPDRLREADAAGLRLLHKPVAVELLMRSIQEEMERYRSPIRDETRGPCQRTTRSSTRRRRVRSTK